MESLQSRPCLQIDLLTSTRNVKSLQYCIPNPSWSWKPKPQSILASQFEPNHPTKTGSVLQPIRGTNFISGTQPPKGYLKKDKGHRQTCTSARYKHLPGAAWTEIREEEGRGWWNDIWWLIWVFPKIMVPPNSQIIHFNRVFHYL